jgi:hypothetical protein
MQRRRNAHHVVRFVSILGTSSGPPFCNTTYYNLYVDLQLFPLFGIDYYVYERKEKERKKANGKRAAPSRRPPIDFACSKRGPDLSEQTWGRQSSRTKKEKKTNDRL